MSDETGEPVALEQTLRRSSVATLSMQLLKRGYRHCYMRGVRPLGETRAMMVGRACTLRFVPFREDRDALTSLGDPANPSRRAIDDCPEGHVLVVDARGVRDCGTLGDILAARLKVRGASGFVSDGGVRDSGAVIATGLPVFCAGPAAPASPTLHTPADTQVPIACGGVAVYPGDVIVGDNDGVLVIPPALAAEVAAAAAEQEDLESYIVQLVRAGRPVVGTYPADASVMEGYREWVRAGRPADGDRGL